MVRTNMCIAKIQLDGDFINLNQQTSTKGVGHIVRASHHLHIIFRGFPKGFPKGFPNFLHDIPSVNELILLLEEQLQSRAPRCSGAIAA